MVENEEVETPYYGPLPLGGDVPYFRKTGVTRRAETFYTTGHEPGGKFWLQREAEAVKERAATAERERVSAYLDLQARQLRTRQAAETKARQERERVLEERRLQQVSTRRGISIQRVKQQQVQQRAEEQLVIKAAEDIRASGKAFSQTEYAQQLARRSGLDPSTALQRLQSGTAREKKVFRRTGISLEEERRKELEAQPTDPLRQMLSVGESLEPRSLWKETSEGMERWAREKITYPIAERLSSIGLDLEGYSLIVGATAPTFVTPGLTIMPTKKEREFQVARTRGQILELKERPIKTALTTAAFFVLPGVLKPVGKVVAPIAKALPTLSKAVSSAVKIGLPTAYAGVTGYRVIKEPTAKARGERLGRIETGEILPMFLGGYAGAKVWPRVRGLWVTRGREKIPTEKLIPKEIIIGKKRFPEAPPKEHYKLFMKESKRIPPYEEPMMFHQTGARFWKGSFVAEPGSSEFKGLYGSYGISPHFLRVQEEVGLYGGRLFEPYGKPGTLAIIPKKFVKGVSAPKGYAFIPGVKKEVEAILPPGTIGKVVSKAYYYKWKGVRIPIDIARVSGIEKGAVTTAQTISKLAYSYGATKPYPIITPSSLALSSYLGLKPSKPSKVSRVSKRVSISKEISKAISYSPIGYKRITRGLQEPFYYSYKTPKKPPTKITPYYPTEELIREPFLRTEQILLGAARIVKKKKKEVKGKFREELFYVPSMTAHVLGIKKVMSEKEMLRKAQLGITLREVPIIR